MQNHQSAIPKRMLINTLSNYGKMIIGMGITIFLTRILFLGLSREEYGFWALLWSIFGYSLLLDFGFGTAVQKHTSESVVTQDWDKYNRVVSTVFFNYVAFAFLIVVFAVVLSFNLGRFFGIAPENEAYFAKTIVLFGTGSAIAFPFGFFAEILRGLQKMHTRNIIQICYMLLNFIGMAIMMKLKQGLIGMVFVALGTNILSSLTMMIVVHRLIPTFQLSPANYDRSLLVSVMSFSLYAYLITFTNIIILKTDQLVISVFGSVAMVAVYQISIRLADTYQKFSAQFLDNLGPVAATLFAAGDKSKVNQILLQSNRLMGIISSLLIVPIIVYVKPLLNIWLQLDHPAGMICAMILLASMYVLLFFRSSSVYVLLMANEHRILAFVAIIEALLNLGLSILFMKLLPVIFYTSKIPDIGMIGVALGTFLPNFILAFSFNIPKACRFAGISISQYFRDVVLRTLIVSFISLGFAYFLGRIYYPGRLLIVLLYGALTAVFYLILTYFIGLNGEERRQLSIAIKSRIAPDKLR